MQKTTIVTLCVALPLLAACENMGERDRRVATGAGAGAVAGAVVGSATGGKALPGAVIGGALGAVAGNVWSRHLEKQQAELEQSTRGTGVEVSRTQDNQLKLHVPADISFDVGRADIKPELRQVLDQFAQGMRNQQGVRVRVVGHTDNTGSDAINDRLSSERAERVRSYLVDRGVAGPQVETVGRGSREPVASNATADGRARNRRVELFMRDTGQTG